MKHTAKTIKLKIPMNQMVEAVLKNRNRTRNLHDKRFFKLMEILTLTEGTIFRKIGEELATSRPQIGIFDPKASVTSLVLIC